MKGVIKKSNTKKTSMQSILCLSLVVAMTCTLYGDSDSIEINFDRLYPDTPFKIAVRSCFSILQVLDVYDHRTCKKKDYELLTDMIIGKLFCILMDIKNIKRQTLFAHQEDMQCIAYLFDTIAVNYKRICACPDYDHKYGYVFQLIDAIKSACKNVGSLDNLF